MVFSNAWRALARDKRGLSTVEYVLLLVLIVAGSVKLWNDFGEDFHKKLKTSQEDYKKVKKITDG